MPKSFRIFFFQINLSFSKFFRFSPFTSFQFFPIIKEKISFLLYSVFSLFIEETPPTSLRSVSPSIEGD